MLKFCEIQIGTYFSMKQGLLFRKVNDTVAVDVWSGRQIMPIPETECQLMKGDNDENN